MSNDHSHAVKGLLTAAVEAFHFVVQNQDVLRNASTAIRLVLLACDDDLRPQFADEDAAVLAHLIERAAPAIATATGFNLEDEEVYLGLSALHGLAAELLTRAEISRANAGDLIQSRFDHAALLSDELDAIFRRREIERRGDAFRRFIAYRRFERAGRFGQSLQ